MDMFRKQMSLAQEFNLPVEIHTRDAEEDTLNILSEYKGRVRGILHCFTSSQEMAKRALDLGYNISFSGVITFKNADALREVVRFVPLERMHIETDAPFLTPVPLRGKKNEPAFVKHVAEKVAELKGTSLEALSEALKKNAKEMFSRIEWQ
jgi:TatD DNase family protein